MLDRALDCIAGDTASARTLRAVRPAELATLFDRLAGAQAGFLRDCGFSAAAQELVLLPGGDGVTEAMNAASDEFGDERLLAAIQQCRTKAPQEILDALFADVRAFCGEATQSDDVTIVMVRYDG